MILESKHRNAHLLSACSAGITLLCLGIGLNGASQPLHPHEKSTAAPTAGVDAVMIENFEPPAAPADSVTDAVPAENSLDLDIPALPTIIPPLTAPEMIEIVPLESMREPALSKSPEPKVEPTPAKPRPKLAARPATSPTTDSNAGNSSASAQVFSGGGRGRFPSPSFPTAARAAKQQGTVRLLVTVEASGIPSVVEILASSGFAALDNTARDTIQRRWRWPRGEPRQYIVPIRFVLQ